MEDKFSLVKDFLHEMDVSIVKENKEEQLVVVDDEANGIRNMIIDCEEPIVVIEQVIMSVPENPRNLYKKLLKFNRELVHGAFALDEDEKYIIFRDTLQLENLDRNELQSSIHALTLALSEYSAEFLNYK